MSIKKKQHYVGSTLISRLALYLFLLHILILTGCAPAMYDASFKGKVVDSDTREPIEGAVALGFWTTWMMTPAGETTDYYDVCETVTDSKGEFFIPGKGPRVVTNLNPMQITVFKAGYRHSSGTLEFYSRYAKVQNGILIIPLKKLTMEQRKISLGPGIPPDGAPLSKVKYYLMEINREMVERGVPPIKTWNGEVINENK